MSTPPRPLRADAERNRLAIVCAAGSLFARAGTGVTLEQVATAAGVGVGTVYRRFATVDDLLAVVLEEKMRRYADRAESAATRAEHEPWAAFSEWVLFSVEEQATDLAFSDVLLSTTAISDSFAQEFERTLRASVRLVERARSAGVIRPDFDHSDLLLLQHANAGLIRATHEKAPEAWRRFADYMLQAFRVSDAPLSAPAASWQSAASRFRAED